MPHGAVMHAVQKQSDVTTIFLHCMQVQDWKSGYPISARWMSETTFGFIVNSSRTEIQNHFFYVVTYGILPMRPSLIRMNNGKRYSIVSSLLMWNVFCSALRIQQRWVNLGRTESRPSSISCSERRFKFVFRDPVHMESLQEVFWFTHW